MTHGIVFGTDGWRAIIADQFTMENVQRVVYATGLYIRETYWQQGRQAPLVLVGYDPRFLADRFAQRAAEVLVSMGFQVRLADRDVPTPVLAYAACAEATGGALQFTASHNPPEYCGIKYIPHYGGPATNAITAKIASYLNDLPAGFKAPSLELEKFDFAPAYFKAINERIHWEKVRQSKIRIACDTMYSTSRGYLDRLLEENGVPVKALHNWRDPLFGGFMPEPRFEFLQELSKLVPAEGFDVGIATDGDGDRFGAIDELGNFAGANKVLPMVARHLVKNRGMSGAIVRTVSTTHLLDRLGELYGFEVIETPVGFKYIGEVMRSKTVLIGGEESGGMSINGHIPEKDGIMSNLLLAEMMAYEGKPLSQIWSDLLEETGFPVCSRTNNLGLPVAAQSELIEELLSKPFATIGQAKVEKVGVSDGLKFYLDGPNWVLVRRSGTEPLLRIYYEAGSEQRLRQTMSEFECQISPLMEALSAKHGGKVRNH